MGSPGSTSALEAADATARERAAAVAGEAPLGVGESPEGRRVLVHASGFRQSPYADVRPAGVDVQGTRGSGSLVPDPAPSGPPRKLWHASPGSSGH